MDADDDEFMTANNDGYGLDDDDILTRWEEMLPPGMDYCPSLCPCIDITLGFVM